MTGMKIRKVNKTHRGVTGDIVMLVSDVDNEMLVEARLAQKQGGEYRLLPYKLPQKKLCSFFDEDTIFFPEFTKASNISLPFPCPVPKVTIAVHALSIFTYLIFFRLHTQSTVSFHH